MSKVMRDRMPPLAPEQMNEAQRRAADELTRGPRGGVFGPFIPLLRSPELMDRLQKVGEYLRFQNALETRISEFVVLVTSRWWTQQFEWAIHHPLALKAGVKAETPDALADGRRPAGMAGDEEIAYDFCDELLRNRGVSDASYERAVQQFGEQGVIDMAAVVGYFTTMAMVLNVAHTPRSGSATVAPLLPFPL